MMILQSLLGIVPLQMEKYHENNLFDAEVQENGKHKPLAHTQIISPQK